MDTTESYYGLYRASNNPSVFTITEKAPTRAFSWLKVENAYTMLINPPFPYDFCVATQFHVYLP